MANPGYTNPYESFSKDIYAQSQARMDNRIAGQAGAQAQIGAGGQAGNQQPNRAANPYMSADNMVSTGVGALGSIGDAMNQKSTDPADYSVDPWAGYTGSAKGFGSGGLVGAIVGGAVAQLGTFNKVHSNLKDLSDNIDTTVQRDALGRPMYNGQPVYQASRNINALRKGVKAINNSLDPATHAISYIRGTERQIKRKIRRVRSSIQSGNTSFTQAAQEANQNQLAMSQYNNLMNKTSRTKSLYNIGQQGLY